MINLEKTFATLMTKAQLPYYKKQTNLLFKKKNGGK